MVMEAGLNTHHIPPTRPSEAIKCAQMLTWPGHLGVILPFYPHHLPPNTCLPYRLHLPSSIFCLRFFPLTTGVLNAYHGQATDTPVMMWDYDPN